MPKTHADGTVTDASASAPAPPAAEEPVSEAVELATVPAVKPAKRTRAKKA